MTTNAAALAKELKLKLWTVPSGAEVRESKICGLDILMNLV